MWCAVAIYRKDLEIFTPLSATSRGKGVVSRSLRSCDWPINFEDNSKVSDWSVHFLERRKSTIIAGAQTTALLLYM